MNPDSILLRPIIEADDASIAQVIRTSLEEFSANRPGTVYYDETTDHLTRLFESTPGSFYFIAEDSGTVVGGGGIYPTEGLPEGTCELVKMYLRKEARGLGLGSRMIKSCIDKARESGYSRIYLETMPELKNALRAYERLGFEYLSGPLGNSGHFGCDVWMLKTL